MARWNHPHDLPTPRSDREARCACPSAEIQPRSLSWDPCRLGCPQAPGHSRNRIRSAIACASPRLLCRQPGACRPHDAKNKTGLPAPELFLGRADEKNILDRRSRLRPLRRTHENSLRDSSFRGHPENPALSWPSVQAAPDRRRGNRYDRILLLLSGTSRFPHRWRFVNVPAPEMARWRIIPSVQAARGRSSEK